MSVTADADDYNFKIPIQNEKIFRWTVIRLPYMCYTYYFAHKMFYLVSCETKHKCDLY